MKTRKSKRFVVPCAVSVRVDVDLTECGKKPSNAGAVKEPSRDFFPDRSDLQLERLRDLRQAAPARPQQFQ